jgi:phosphomannomutase
MTLAAGMRACSFDGDADRLVYYYMDEGKLVLLHFLRINDVQLESLSYWTVIK